jgi:hypothetical protein
MRASTVGHAPATDAALIHTSVKEAAGPYWWAECPSLVQPVLPLRRRRLSLAIHLTGKKTAYMTIESSATRCHGVPCRNKSSAKNSTGRKSRESRIG